MSKSDAKDTTFFREQMQDVKRLKKSGKIFTLIRLRSLLPPAGEGTKYSCPSTYKNQSDIFQFFDHLTETVTSATVLTFAQPDMPAKVLRDLRLGKIAQTKILDLHGYTVEQARDQLSQFLTGCIKQEQRCVRLIHGKGKLDIKEPVLKNHVNSWLRQHPAILAFHSAIPRDGGTGAVYILLKRNKLKGAT